MEKHQPEEKNILSRTEYGFKTLNGKEMLDLSGYEMPLWLALFILFMFGGLILISPLSLKIVALFILLALI